MPWKYKQHALLLVATLRDTIKHNGCYKIATTTLTLLTGVKIVFFPRSIARLHSLSFVMF